MSKSTKSISYFLALFFLFSAAAVSADYEQDQNFGDNGVITNHIADNDDLGVAMEVDSDGYIHIAGYTATESGVSSIVYWKYDSGGNLVSGFPKIHGSGTDDYIGIGLDIDSNGCVYISGCLYPADSANDDLILLKYDSEGNLVSGWPKTYNSSGVIGDYGFLMTIDTNDNIYIAGGVDDAGSNSQAALWKYDTDGNLASGYPKIYSGVGNYDIAVGVAVDSDGNVYTGGYSENAAGNYDAALWKYDSGGNLVSGWPKTYDSSINDNDHSYGVALDSQNNVYLFGDTKNAAGNYDNAIWKYDANGNLVSGYPKTYDGAESFDASLMGVVDSQDNVYSRGFSEDSEGNYDTAIWGYDSSGNVLAGFPKTYGGEDSVDFGYGIIIDSYSNLFVTGSVTGITTFDMLLIKYITNPSTPSASPAGGSYSSSQQIGLSSTGDATIYYTTDGTDPTSSSTVYSEPIALSDNMTLKAIAYKSQLASTIMSETYSIDTSSTTLRGYLRVKGNKFKGKGGASLYTAGGKKIKEEQISQSGKFRFINLAAGNKYCLEGWAKKRITQEEYYENKNGYLSKYSIKHGTEWENKFMNKYIIDEPTEEEKLSGKTTQYYKKYEGEKCFTLSDDRTIKLKLK